MPIEIAAEPRTLLDVDLVGVRYQLHPPKSSLSIKIAIRAKTAGDDPSLIMETLNEWMDKAFGLKAAKQIRARLDDENDPLDIEHIMKLMEAVIEATSGNPTTSPSG